MTINQISNSTIIVTVTATRATEERQFPAFILRGVGSYADAVGCQEPDGSWYIGIEARAYDGQGLLGIGTVVMPDGTEKVWSSCKAIDRRFTGTIDEAMHRAEEMLDLDAMNEE